MALLFADGFEHYGAGSTNSGAVRAAFLAGLWADVGLGWIYNNPANARTGNRYFECSSGGPSVVINTNDNEIGAAFGMYMEVLPSTVNNGAGFAVRNELNTDIIRVRATPTGSIDIRTSSDTLIASTDAGTVTAGAWYHYEIRLLQDNVVGEIELRINGEVVLFLTDLNLGTLPPRIFRLSGASSGTHTRFYDDLIVWDTTGDVNNTFFGPARVNTVYMNTDDVGNQWSVVGAGSGAAAISENAPDGDTSYIQAATVGQTSRFTPQTLPVEVEAIAGIFVPAMGKLASAGEGNFQLSIISDSNIANGPEYILTSAYTYWPSVFEKDPATGAQFDRAGFSNLLFQVEKTK